MNRIILTSLFTLTIGVVSFGCLTSKSLFLEKQDIQTVTIDTEAVLRRMNGIPIGINLNFYLDSDKATKASTPLAIAIKNMGVKYLRYPGGDKSDEYLFAYPPYDKAKPHPTRQGKGSSLGRSNFMDEAGNNYIYPAMDFDEFIQICRETDCEPIIVVAADTRNHPFPEGVTGVSMVEEMLKNAVEWVRYSNIKKQYGVKYWMIGNESWHDNVKKYYSLDDYIFDIRLFSDAMKAIDPTIKIIPNTTGKGDFTKRILKEAGDKIDMLCISNYPLFNWNGYADWAIGHKDVMGPYKKVAAQVAQYAPAVKKDMQIIIAEY
jgi:alpha-L-arabinofuranosidase